jgi:hypothetical protein
MTGKSYLPFYLMQIFWKFLIMHNLYMIYCVSFDGIVFNLVIVFVCGFVLELLRCTEVAVQFFHIS